MTAPKQIILSGKVVVKYIDDNAPSVGDLMLYLADDATSVFVGEYDSTGRSGAIKAQLYDGRFWQFIDITEFCENRENKYAKKHRPIDNIHLCAEILSEFQGVTMYRTYRGHFTRHEYEPQEYIRKKKYGKKK